MCVYTLTSNSRPRWPLNMSMRARARLHTGTRTAHIKDDGKARTAKHTHTHTRIAYKTPLSALRLFAVCARLSPGKTGEDVRLWPALLLVLGYIIGFARCGALAAPVATTHTLHTICSNRKTTDFRCSSVPTSVSACIYNKYIAGSSVLNISSPGCSSVVYSCNRCRNDIRRPPYAPSVTWPS